MTFSAFNFLCVCAYYLIMLSSLCSVVIHLCLFPGIVLSVQCITMAEDQQCPEPPELLSMH